LHDHSIPFAVPLQDDSVSFQFPIDEGFYKLTKPVVFIDGHVLDRNDLKTATISERIHQCLQNEAAIPPIEVVAVFTRTSFTNIEDFYGSVSELQ
jgi:hypothetical protein